jgi:hypothetical protein
MIPDSVDVEGEYTAFQLIRQGLMLQVQNVILPREVIKVNNWWRKAMKVQGLTPGMSMIERYLEARASVPTLIWYSREI